MLNFESDRHVVIVIQWTSGKTITFFAIMNNIACSDMLNSTFRDKPYLTKTDTCNKFIGQ